MIRKLLVQFFMFSLIIGLFCMSATSQSLSRIEKYIEREEYDKFKDLLDKSEEKDSTRIGVKYYYSTYYLTANKPFYNLDLSDQYIRKAIFLFNKASAEQINDLQEDGISKEVILNQKQKVNSQVFDRTKNALSLASINDFILRFEDASQIDEAIFLRDSLAFEEAKVNSTAKSFLAYYQTYEKSSFRNQSKVIYDSLLYYENAQPTDLKSLTSFVKTYPESPYLEQAISHIYRLSTEEHKLSNYLDFIDKYPTNELVKTASNYAYYLDKLATLEALSTYDFIDSLKLLYRLESKLLYPYSESAHIGFFNNEGHTEIIPQFMALQNHIRCDGLSESVFIAKSTSDQWNVYNRNTHILIENIDPKGFEIINGQIFTLDQNGISNVYHLSGELLIEDAEDVAIINSQWIKVFKNSENQLLNFQGKLHISGFESIKTFAGFYIFEKDDSYFIANDLSLKNMQDPSDFSKLMEAEDYEFVNDHLILFKGNKEALLDQTLRFKVDWGEHEVYFDYNQWIVEKEGSIQVLDNEIASLGSQYEELKSNAGWLALKSKGTWTLKSRENINVETTGIDSLQLTDEGFAQIHCADSSYLLFQNGFNIRIEPKDLVIKLPGTAGANHHFASVIKENKTIMIIDSVGVFLPLTSYKELFFINDTLFRFTVKGKVGLVNNKNEIRLQPEYSVMEKNGDMLYLLKDSFIGSYDLRKGVTINASYEQKVEPLGVGYLVKKNESYKWIDQHNKNLINDVFEEVKHWNDTAIWTYKNDSWSLISHDETVLFGGISEIKTIANRENTILSVVLKDHKYALFNPSLGQLSPFIYDDIFMVGKDIIFAEERLSIAGYNVITYYDTRGKIIKTQAYRQAYYHQIFCDK